MKRANYRAPRKHREVLIVPDRDRLPELVRSNRAVLDAYAFDLLGRPIQDLRRAARRGMLTVPYTCIFDRQTRPRHPDLAAPLVLTGHQPELYHPGVWLKNFLAGNLARAVGGVAVNLNVDNDEAHELAIRAPVVEGGRTRAVEVAYLRPTGGVPYEELGEDSLLDGIAEGLRSQGVAESLCEATADYWRRLDAARGRGSLAKVVTCARHQLELDVRLNNFEALVSDVARLPEYRVFMLDILSRLAEFHDAHNGGLATFRRVHHERNPAQPIPDLLREAHRREMPFWVWRAGGNRQRLWAEIAGDRFLLFMDDSAEPFVRLPRAEMATAADRAVAQLDEQESRGIKIRPRALTLTLFARVFLGDVFIHGLGGAVYDKVTDEIVRRYYGVEPPQLVMATGTAWLPLERFEVSTHDRRGLERRMRDIRHNADRLMAGSVRRRSDVRALVDRKGDLIGNRRQTRPDRDDAWRELHDVNRRLAAMLDGEPRATRRQLREVNTRLDQNAVLSNREYAFVLHPRDELMDFYREATAVRPGGGP